MPPLKTYRQTPKRRKKAQRASLQKTGIRRFVNFSLLLAVFVAAIWTSLYRDQLYESLSTKTEQAMATVGFRLEDVIVEGRKRTDKTTILTALGLERNVPLLSIPLKVSKQKLEKFPWVKSARLERRLPNTLYIRLAEKEPVAIWHQNSRTYLIDRDGEFVETKEPQKFKGLLAISGHDVSRHVPELISLLEKFPTLKKRVSSAIHLRASRWDIKLDHQVDIKLPEKDPQKALEYFLALEQNHQLSKQDIIAIDMRLPGQLILKLTPEAAQRKTGMGNDT